MALQVKIKCRGEKKEVVLVALSGCQSAAWTSSYGSGWTSKIGDTKITSFWKHDLEKHDLNWKSRACCICKSPKRDSTNGVTKGLSQVPFPKNYRRKPPFYSTRRLWKQHVLLHHVPCPVVLRQSRDLGSTLHLEPPQSYQQDRSQVPAWAHPALHSPQEQEIRGKIWGSSSTARKAVINICI